MNPFAYTQARLQARHGARPGEPVWSQLRTLVELDALLEQARATPLRRWLTSIAPDSPPHEIERLLRTRLRETIHDVAGWLPPAWRPAVLWTEALPDLPALAWLLDGQAPLPWMSAEVHLKPLAAVEPELRRSILMQGPLAALAAVRAGDPAGAEGLRRRWLDEWRRRLPADTPLLRRLTREIESHRRRFAATGGGWAARRALEQRVVAIFRQGLFTPAAAFAFLVLSALELERVRAELVGRALFGAGEE